MTHFNHPQYSCSHVFGILELNMIKIYQNRQDVIGISFIVSMMQLIDNGVMAARIDVTVEPV